MKIPQYVAYSEDITKQKKVGFYFFLIEPKINRHFIPLLHLQAASSTWHAAHTPHQGS